MTKRPYRAVILDDVPKWRNMVAEILTENGFRVDTAASPAELKEAMKSSFYHLFIFDKSLEEPSGSNRDGLDLLAELRKDKQLESSAVILLTAYNDTKVSREALRGQSLSDVLDKQSFDDSEFVEQAQALLDRLPMNRSLGITWDGSNNSAEELVANLVVGGIRAKKGSELHKRLSEEFDDLLTRVFASAGSIIVTAIERGRSGSGVALVEPFFDDRGSGQPVVLKFGDVKDIQMEKENYRTYVLEALRGGRHTALVYEGQTALLGAIGYSLLEAQEFESFTTFYRRASTEEVAKSIDDLFLVTCNSWYANMSPPRGRDLAADYRERLGCTLENLTDALTKLKNVHGGEHLTFSSMNEPATVKNPLRVAFKGTIASGTHECVTHGDLNDGNIMVDQTGATWLIDFRQTEKGHVLRDFALLDVCIRCSLCGPDDATLDERLALERAVLAARKIDSAGAVVGHLDSSNPATQKAFAASLHIRSLAAKQVHHHASADMRDYFIASFFYELNLIRFVYRLSTVQREHALLAAGLTAEHLRL